MKLLRLRPRRSPDGARLLAAANGLANVFNPSQLAGASELHCAFRALPPSGKPPFDAWLASFGAESAQARLVSLTEHARGFGAPIVADPKLFQFGGDTWATFNTGFSKRAPNELYLLRVTPTLGRPLRCVYAERQRIEKNWAFYDDGGALMALYGLCPVTTLRAVRLDEREGVAEFVLESRGDARSGADLSIGTQPLVGGGRLRLIAHQKVQALGRRAYLGRPVSVDLAAARVSVTPTWLIHSLRALLPPRRRHNPNLWACTYFSGLDEPGPGRVRLGYGINDLGADFAEVSTEQLWPSEPTTGTSDE